MESSLPAPSSKQLANNSVQRVYVIGRNAFREAIRDRILYNLIIFVLLITASAIFFGELTGGQQARMVVDLGLSSVLIFGTFISIFVGVSLVWKEIEKRTVYAVFAKPVGRGEFIVGKYLGLCSTVLLNVVLMGFGISLALGYVHGSTLLGVVWTELLLIFFELSLITAVAIMFSSFSTPALSALLAFFIFVIGNFSASLQDAAADLGSDAAKLVFSIIYYVLPNFSHFSFVTQAANGISPRPVMIAGAAVYAIVYDAILLTLTVAIFKRRNFK